MQVSPLVGELCTNADHSNLQFLHISTNWHIQRWSLLLAEFDYTIEYRPGATNCIADYLSRALPSSLPLVPSAASVSPVAPPVSDPFSLSGAEFDLSVFVSASPADPDAPVLRGFFAHQVATLPSSIVDNTLVLSARPPDDILRRLWSLAHAHPLCGHASSKRTLLRLASAIRWPSMHTDVLALMRSCPALPEASRAPVSSSRPRLDRLSQPIRVRLP